MILNERDGKTAVREGRAYAQGLRHVQGVRHCPDKPSKYKGGHGTTMLSEIQGVALAAQEESDRQCAVHRVGGRRIQEEEIRVTKSEIRELEELARRFIIGYAPLTDEQLGLIADIRLVEQKTETIRKRLRRYERVHTILYRKLDESWRKNND